MKERPILFSGPMVRAILEGRKTQTRRVMKTPPDTFEDAASVLSACPFGKAGDRLWVRETWAEVPRVTDNGPKHKTKGDGTGATWRADWQGNPSGFKWRPSIHMPRWASRITLEITGVRVERLQVISKADAMKEGLEGRDWLGPAQFTDDKGRTVHGDPVSVFRELWESINGPDSWSLNPWVWVIEFKTVTGEA